MANVPSCPQKDMTIVLLKAFCGIRSKGTAITIFGRFGVLTLILI